jgi:predicted XRE-type DNA-binding protein
MTYKPVPRDDELRNEVLADPEARAMYEATKLQIELSSQLKKARLKQNMTQEEVASILHTQKPVISRLETCHENVKNFPSLLTLVKFASAIGYELKIGLVPMKTAPK